VRENSGRSISNGPRLKPPKMSCPESSSLKAAAPSDVHTESIPGWAESSSLKGCGSLRFARRKYPGLGSHAGTSAGALGGVESPRAGYWSVRVRRRALSLKVANRIQAKFLVAYRRRVAKTRQNPRQLDGPLIDRSGLASHSFAGSEEPCDPWCGKAVFIDIVGDIPVAAVTMPNSGV